MKFRLVLCIGTGLTCNVALFAQAPSRGAAPTTGSAGSPTLPASTTSPNSRSPFPNTTTGPDTLQRPLYLAGRVTLDDGTPPSEPVTLKLVCNANPRSVGFTDSKGRFSIDIRDRNNAAMFEDASENGTGRMGGMGSANSSNSSGSSTGSSGSFSERALMGCELRATLAGFRSDGVNLGARHSMDNPDVGTIVLHRLANVEGSSISVTSALAPKDAKKAFDKAMNDIKKDKWDDAEKELSKAVDVYPKYAAAWYQLGLTQQHENNVDAARKSYSQALAADSRYVNPYQELAVLAVRQQNWKEAADDTDRLLRLNPVDFPQAWLFNALANYQLKNLDVAEKSARQGLSADPTHHFVKFDQILGVILASKGDYAGAAEHLKAYLKLDPNGPDAEMVKKQLAELDKATAAQAAKAPAAEPDKQP